MTDVPSYPGLRSIALPPATAAQLATIRALGGHPPADLTRRQASLAVQALRRRRGLTRRAA